MFSVKSHSCRSLAYSVASRPAAALLLAMLLTALLWAIPAFAQKNIEDLPIADTVPTAAPAAVPEKPSGNIEDLPIADNVPAASPDAAPESVAENSEEGDVRVGPLEIWKTFTHPKLGFIRSALWAGLLVAVMSSFLGVYVVLKRIVFVGVALTELSSAGIAIGLWLGFSPILGAMLLMLLGVGIFAIRWSPRRVPTESVIGIVYSIAGAASVLCLVKSASGDTNMLNLLRGEVLTVSTSETLEMLAVFLVIALIHIAFIQEFVLVSFDRDAASTMGFNAAGWDFLLYLTIGIVIAFAIRATGVLLATTLLIMPAATALLLANNLKKVWPMAIACGVLSVILGLHVTAVVDVPASAASVAVSFLMLVLAQLISRRS